MHDESVGVLLVDLTQPDLPVALATATAARLLGRAGESLARLGLASILERIADPEAVQEVRRRLDARDSGFVPLQGPCGTRWLSVRCESGCEDLAVCLVGSPDDDAEAMRHAPYGMLLLDSGCRVITANRAAAALAGKRREDLVGTLWMRLAPDGPNAAALPAILQELRALRPWRGDLAAPRGLPGAPLVEATLSPVAAPDGTLSRIAVVEEDATPRRRRESEHLRICQLETLTLIAGGTAHDLNNIFTALAAETDTLARQAAQGGTPPDPAIQRLGEGVRRAQRIVLQLLATTRVQEPTRSRVQAAQFVRHAVEFALHGSNVRGEIRLADSLGDIEADEGQLGQIIDNLVINARQAMPHGGRLTVTGSRRTIAVHDAGPLAGGDYVEVVFADDGPGIPRELLGRIFEPYFTTKPGGNGLGLATARRIVEQHGGSLTAASPSGRGAVFTLLLPLANLPAAPAAQAPLPRPKVPDGLHILLVDDDRLVARAVTRMLNAQGVEVTHAADGAEGATLCARQRAAGRPFAIALVDATIPGGAGGTEALALLRAVQPGMPAVLVSGYPGADTSGFQAALHKPFSSDDLLRTLASLLAPPAG